MCACTDNTFNLYENEGVGDKIEPNGHITRVNPKDMAGLVSADSSRVSPAPIVKIFCLEILKTSAHSWCMGK